MSSRTLCISFQRCRRQGRALEAVLQHDQPVLKAQPDDQVQALSQEVKRVRCGSEGSRRRRGFQESPDLRAPLAADAPEAGRLIHVALQVVLGGDDPEHEQAWSLIPL